MEEESRRMGERTYTSPRKSGGALDGGRNKHAAGELYRRWVITRGEMNRSTSEVLRNHLVLRANGKLEEDLERNYSEEVG